MAGITPTPLPPISLALKQVPTNLTLEVLQQPATQVIITSAVRGPKGDPGSASASGITFAQSTPSANWLITHNFGYVPNVTVYDSSGDECDATVIATATTVNVIGAGAFSGTARLI